MDPRVKKVVDEIKELETQIGRLCQKVALARREYFQGEKTEKGKKHLESLEEEGEGLSKKYSSLVKELQWIAGVPDHLLEAFEEERYGGTEGEVAIQRRELTTGEVPPTGFIEDELPAALEHIYRLLDQNWLKEQRRAYSKIQNPFIESSLSLVRGIRIESEFPPIHRFAQAVFACEEHLENKTNADIFAAALLVPQTASLGAHLPFLNYVRRETDDRVEHLWRGRSEEVDSTVFELLVATSCAALGRTVEFLKATDEKTPDIRVHDYPFPLVVECKRKRVLSDYEVGEERRMQLLFRLLGKAASAKGMWGIFDLELAVEAGKAPLDEIVDCSVRQRLAASHEKATSYLWGSIAFRELPKNLRGPKTRLYSPLFLTQVFSWDCDLPTHDGIICRIASPKEPIIDFAREPIAMVWKSSSEEAVRKRSWSPINLFGDATNQVPGGEVGIIYVCYQEGARESFADRRTHGYITGISQWVHSAAIRLPVSFLIRIYPRVLSHGAPDLIENGVSFMSDLYGSRVYLSKFPATVFTLLNKLK